MGLLPPRQKQVGVLSPRVSSQPETTGVLPPRSGAGAAKGLFSDSPLNVTQSYGNINPGVEVFSHGGVNTGLDLGMPEGTPVKLPKAYWQVEEVYDKASRPGYIGDNENSGYGNSVVVKNLLTGEKVRLSHLSKVGVKPGQLLDEGEIGQSGATGNVTGAHLDLTLYDPSGKTVDPLQSDYAKGIE